MVLDQLGTWALERHFHALPADGLLRRAAAEGVLHRRVRYGYGATITAAGHASLFTGVLPRVHGVVANDLYDPERGAQRALVDDGEHALFGAPGFASPSVLRAQTVGDALVAHHPSAKVVSLSIKDRAAVLSGGHRPSFVAFYDSRVPGFTSSSYYFDALPGWFTNWRARHPVERYYETWEPLEGTARAAGVPDDRSVEGHLPGFGSTFPHDVRSSARPASLLRFTPSSTRMLLDLAEAAVDAYDLGGDEIPDLLALSVSATDYIGHAFGAESWEYLDNLIRTDRWLGELVRRLEKKTSVAVLVTSDHGHAPTPEDPAPTRLKPPALVAELDATLVERFGPGKYVAGYYIPYLYLTEAARTGPDAAAIESAVIEALRARPDVALAERSEVAAGWLEHPDELHRAVAAGIALDRAGPVYVVPAEGVVVDPNLGGGGTTHGTPYAYDRDVPVFVLGARVGRLETEEPLDLLQVAPTLARLLGIPPPPLAKLPPLPGVHER